MVDQSNRDEEKPSVARFWTRFIHTADNADVAAAKLARDLAKWVFDWTRNVIVLGVLKYFADQTASAYVQTMYVICSVMLVLFVASYWQALYFKPFGGFVRNKYTDIADLIVNVLMGVAIVITSYQIIGSIAEEIARAQGAVGQLSPNGPASK